MPPVPPPPLDPLVSSSQLPSSEACQTFFVNLVKWRKSYHERYVRVYMAEVSSRYLEFGERE